MSIVLSITPSNPVAPQTLLFDATGSTRTDSEPVVLIQMAFPDTFIYSDSYTVSKLFPTFGSFWVDIILAATGFQNEVQRFYFSVLATSATGSYANTAPDPGQALVTPIDPAAASLDYLIAQYEFLGNSPGAFDTPSIPTQYRMVLRNEGETDPVVIVLTSSESYVNQDNVVTFDYEFVVQPLDVEEFIGKIVSGTVTGLAKRTKIEVYGKQ